MLRCGRPDEEGADADWIWGSTCSAWASPARFLLSVDGPGSASQHAPPAPTPDARHLRHNPPLPPAAQPAVGFCQGLLAGRAAVNHRIRSRGSGLITQPPGVVDRAEDQGAYDPWAPLPIFASGSLFAGWPPLSADRPALTHARAYRGFGWFPLPDRRARKMRQRVPQGECGYVGKAFAVPPRFGHYEGDTLVIDTMGVRSVRLPW